MNKIDSVFYQKGELSPDFELEMREIRNQADALYQGYGKYDLHYHSFWEIDYVISGEGVNIFAGNVYTFEPGDIYIIKPYQYHNAYTTSDIMMLCIQVNLDSVVKSILPENLFSIGDGNFENLIRSSFPHYEKIKAPLERIRLEWEKRQPMWQTVARLSVADLFINLSRYCGKEGENNIQVAEHAGIRRALEFINSNYTKPIRLDEVAGKAIMNKNYFCAVFKKHVGCTFYSYVNNLRLKLACTLLRMTDQSVKEISINSGFSDISTFNKAFKKAFGITPTVYRTEMYGKPKQSSISKSSQ
ncbi:MAG: helix-turn-helix transcriptional regulator [Clostridiales bacterium]|nr:helix-turn-helix transcriptional regulator [Clostridiales bacterium]